jgi:catechol 2,3-dioxygenase-like lactoylglutathione lyase family enzyme
MQNAARPDHLVLLVSSLDASLPYYEALLPLLGFEKLKDHYWRSPHRFIIQVVEARPGARPYERYAAGMNHLGFSVESPEAVRAVRTAMQDRGFEVPDLQDLGGVTALFMKDPDGVRFEISHFPPEIDANADSTDRRG